MTGEETFQFAAAIAGVSIGLGALLLLAAVAVIGVWQLFRRAEEASAAAARAAAAAEELARDAALRPTGPGPGLGELRDQAEALVEQQRQLQEATRVMLDSAAEGAELTVAPGLADVEQSIDRLDATVGQMVAALANLVQRLEERGEES